MAANRAIQLAAAALLLCGCGATAKYQDVSSEPTYQPLIGRQLRATSELLLHGVTLDRNYAKHVDLCSVTPRPGIGGPEIVWSRKLPSGTIFRVVGVRRCTNCRLRERVQLMVQSESTAACGQSPAEIDYQALGSSVILDSE